MTNNKDSNKLNNIYTTDLSPVPAKGSAGFEESLARGSLRAGTLKRNLIAELAFEQKGPKEESELERGRKQRTRFNVALLGLAIAAVNCYAQATFCISIVEMVLPADYNSLLTSDISSNNQSSASMLEAPEVGSLNDHSCPIEYQYRHYYDAWRFQTTPNNLTSEPARDSHDEKPLDLSNRFAWDARQQGLLLGAFAVGTAPLQVIGGRLAETYGSKWVLLAGCVGSGLTNLATPAIAHLSLLLLLLNRVLMGVAQAGMEPGLMCLLAKWLTPSETGYYISMLLFAICIGFFFGSLCTSFILSFGLGWPLTFYVSGWLNLLVGLVWFIYADSTPRESKLIAREELLFIEREQKNDLGKHCDIGGRNETAGNGQAPWKNILLTPSVWAFIICKFSIRWCADVMTLELPIYLANVLHLSIKLNGILNSVSSALFAIFSFLTGFLVDRALPGTSGSSPSILRMSKTNFRKLVQSVASFGSAIAVFLMTSYDCNLFLSMAMMLLLSCLLVVGTGGELQIPYDMTARYPGTLHGMACTLSVSGWLAPPLIGLILADQPTSRQRWSLVWYLTALINLLGGLVFVLFADASPRDFDQPTGSAVGLERAAREHSTRRPLARRRHLSRPSRQPEATGASQKENTWRPLFDRELIRVRQLEESYIERPSYLAYFDSVASGDQAVIYPYRVEKEDSLASSSQLLGGHFGGLGTLAGLLRRLLRRTGSSQEAQAGVAAAESGPWPNGCQYQGRPSRQADLPNNPAELGSTITHL